MAYQQAQCQRCGTWFVYSTPHKKSAGRTTCDDCVQKVISKRQKMYRDRRKLKRKQDINEEVE